MSAKFLIRAVKLQEIAIHIYLDWNSLVQSECVMFSIESHRQWV